MCIFFPFCRVNTDLYAKPFSECTQKALLNLLLSTSRDEGFNVT